jgi:predicted MFS family arabinose efflux permease
MLIYATIEVALIVPLALIFLRRPPELAIPSGHVAARSISGSVLGWPPNLVFALLAVASVFCCMPMAMPQAHLPALCSDLGIPATHGAAMVSVLLGTAFISRQLWGWIADRFGGLNTVIAGSAFQLVTITAFVFTQDEIGLFTVSAASGLGFAGIVPAYIVALRELYPAGEAYWRIPALLLCSGSGMAAGAWVAGALYDHFGFYAPAFAAGVIANSINFLIVAVLVLRQQKHVSRYAIP